MTTLVEQVTCPVCHRRQALSKGKELPFAWFDPTITPSTLDFIAYTRAYGGQGRGVKGKVKALSGFQTESTQTISQAYADPANRPKVTALYKTLKGLVDHMEAIGVR